MSRGSEGVLSVVVEDPLSGWVGAEAVGSANRAHSQVAVWNDSVVRADGRTVVPVEVSVGRGNGDTVGFFSTCFPARLCGSQSLSEGECIRLLDGSDDCLIESSSGHLHLVHIMEGAITAAEVAAAVDLAEQVVN